MSSADILNSDSSVLKKKDVAERTNFLWNHPLLKNIPRTYSPSFLVAGTYLETARTLCLMPWTQTFPTRSEASPKLTGPELTLPPRNLGWNTRQRVEGVISSTDRLIRGHLAIWLNAMLQTEELPAPGKSKRTMLIQRLMKQFWWPVWINNFGCCFRIPWNPNMWCEVQSSIQHFIKTIALTTKPMTTSSGFLISAKSRVADLNSSLAVVLMDETVCL